MLRTNFVFDRRKESPKKGVGQIELRIYLPTGSRLSENEKYYPTGEWIAPPQWDEAKRLINARKHHDGMNANQRLKAIDAKAWEFYRSRQLDRLPCSAADVKDHLAGKSKGRSRENDFVTYLKREVARLRAGHELEEGTLKQTDILIGYLEDLYVEIPFSAMTYGWLKGFDEKLRTMPGRRARKAINAGRRPHPGDENLSASYVGLLMTHLKKYVREAKKEGKISDNPFDHYTIHKGESDPDWLTWEELEAFAAARVDGRRFHNLEVSRARFLFSCYTGLRSSDSARLKPDHIARSIAGLRLVMTPKKTDRYGTSINLPLYSLFYGRPEEMAKELLAGRHRHQPLFTPIDSSTYADHVKAIAEAAGIEKNVTPHVARHTCGMLLLNRFRFDKEAVREILGHKDIKTTDIYSRLENSTLDEIIRQRFAV